MVNYNIDKNNYIELPTINLAINISKFTFAAKNRAYVGEVQKNVYESAEDDLTRWACIFTTNTTVNYQMSHYNLINNSVFFLMYPNKLYEFKLETKEIKHIKDL